MNKSKIISLLVLSILTVLLVKVAIGSPTDPVTPSTITKDTNERFNISLYPQQNITAEAGNISQVTMVAEAQTKAWQGYYGNITGEIVLKDAQGNTFYNWTEAEPRGEIYASTNSSITWPNIHCFNYTYSGDTNDINLSGEEARYGILDIDVDGINETFNTTNPETFYVGTYTIDANTCPTTYIFDNTGYQTNNWINVLLSDNSSLVFTTVIENRRANNLTDQVGFDGGTYDFQMMVPENGHTGDDSSTLYYFWVDLD